MSLKRRNSSSSESDIATFSEQSDDEDVLEYEVSTSPNNQQPQIDQSTGQFGAIPGLADEDALFYGPANDGLDYLRMVRSERKGIPDLLIGDLVRPLAVNDDNGYYQDGAYTGQPQPASLSKLQFNKTQEYYYKALLTHFRLIRATMNCVPPLSCVQALNERRPISFPKQSKTARDSWEQHLLEQDPHPVQIACMDADSVFELVIFITRRMAHFFRSSEINVVTRIGAWIWALLGRCPDKGALGSDEVSNLRAFAQRAHSIAIWLKTPADRPIHEVDAGSMMDEEGGSGAQSSSHNGPDNLFDHRKWMRASDVEQTPDHDAAMCKKLAILDMIITVVGEAYGQRDLLEIRDIWL